MDNADYQELNNESSKPVFHIIAEQNSDNFLIINLIKYSVWVVLAVAAALILYALINWLADNVSVQFLIVRMLVMSFIPIIAMGFLSFLVMKGMRSVFGRKAINSKVVSYSFYDDHFEIMTGGNTRIFRYEEIKRMYRFLDHIVLSIKGISRQFLPPQVFESDFQMLSFETFIKVKLK